MPSLPSGSRTLVVLAGDSALRQPGLERDLLRGGFQVAEAAPDQPIPERAAVILHHLGDLTGGVLSGVLSSYSASRRNGTLLVLVITGGTPVDLVRSAKAGVDEAILLPQEGDLLVARIQARLAAPRGGQDALPLGGLKLFEVVQSVAMELSRDEMLRALVRSLSEELELRSVTVLLHHPGALNGRLVATSEAPKVRNTEVELEQWPEVGAAQRLGETVFLRDVATSPLFLPVLPRLAGGGPAGELESTAAIPLYSMGRIFGSLVLRTRRSGAILTGEQVAFAELAASATARLIDTDDRRSAIARRQSLASHVDPLTGCGTLDALDRRIREEFERSRRYRVTFALVLLDVDSMRSINDRIGRDGGHRVLAELGRLFQRELRGPDFVARYGGEEFLLLLPETDQEGGRRAVHRIRERLREIAPDDLPPGLHYSLTAGVVTYPHPDVHKPEDLFARVEAALVEGKAQDFERIGMTG